MGRGVMVSLKWQANKGEPGCGIWGRSLDISLKILEENFQVYARNRASLSAHGYVPPLLRSELQTS